MPPALYKQGPAAGPQSAELPGPQTPSMLGRKRSRSSEAHGCPPWRGTPQSLSPPPRRRQAPPTRRNAIAPRAAGGVSLDPLIDAMQRLAVGPPPDAVQPKRVCLPGGSSSQAGGCPPCRGTPQSPSMPPRRGKARPRRRKQRQRRRRRRSDAVTPPATSVVSIDPLIDAMQRLAIGTPPNAVQPKRLCLPGSSRGSDTGGCPPWRGTARRRFLRPSKGKAPLRSLRKDNRWRRRRNSIPPRARRARMAFAHATIIVQRAAVGTSGNGMGPRRTYLLRHGGRPRRDSPPKDDVEPMEVDPPQ